MKNYHSAFGEKIKNLNITPIIGLEVHIELATKSKMFCNCSAQHFHIKPNTHTCPVCLGLPGALPVPNQTAINYCLKIGLALNCRVNRRSFFERKNYFYPDLPKGYQISQYQQPFCLNGRFKSIGINRVHLEEDTAKSLHQGSQTLLDFNRSGVPLVEIVSQPDITSAAQAKDFLVSLQRLIRHLGVSPADIEKGSMRCEPTVNIKINGQSTSLVEIKNIASLTGVQKAIDYEINRQSQQPDFSGIKTTRGWDAVKKRTFLQRQKEGSSDYRYFPEPDIPPFLFSSFQIKKIKNSLPPLPDQLLDRFQKLGLSPYQARLLISHPTLSAAFQKAIGVQPAPALVKVVANWFLGPLKSVKVESAKIKPAFFEALFTAWQKGQISSSVAKQLVVESYQTGQHPLKLAKTKNLLQLSQLSQLKKIIQKVIVQNPKAVKDYQKNPNTLGFLIGQVMAASGGSANPQKTARLLQKMLK